MNTRITILLIGTLLIALPALAIISSDFYILRQTIDSERCSKEVENLKLCVENSKIVVNSGEQVRIKIFWVNTGDISRRIGNRHSGYSVTVNDENDVALIPVYKQKLTEWQKKVQNTGEEDKGILLRIQSGSDRGLHAEANGIEKDEIVLTAVEYDYNLTAKGEYYVRIEKTVSSLSNQEKLKFVLENIEIRIK